MKSINATTSGAVIPIVHSDDFTGATRDRWNDSLSKFGFQVCVINGLEDVDMNLSNALEWAVREI